jgi:hypothetical protein
VGRDSPVSIVRIQQSPAVLQAEFRQTHHGIPAFVSEGLENYRTYPLFSPETDKKASEGFARGNKTPVIIRKRLRHKRPPPQRVPSNYSVSFCPARAPFRAFFFSVFSFENSIQGQAAKGKSKLTNS